MDSEITKMLKRSVAVEELLKSITSTNNSAKFYLTKLQAQIGECTSLFGPSKQNTCAICYTRSIEIVNIPCGHLICTECAERVGRRGKCFTCRCEVQSQHKVFL